jgi:DNA-binding NarL/FixJ family response regulator
MSARMITLLVVDDHALFRGGMRLLLADLGVSARVLEAESVEAAVAMDERPDLVLLDLHLCGLSGKPALAMIRERMPDATVVAMSGEEDPKLIRATIEDGASGFIPKTSTPGVMIGALRLVLAGGVYLPPQVLRADAAPVHAAGRAAGRAAAPAAGALDSLTPRQVDSLMLAIRGKSNKAIARDLGVSEGTVKQHLSAAFRVLGVDNRTQAVFAAARLGLAGPPTHAG